MAKANSPRDAFAFSPTPRANRVDFAHEGLRRFDIMRYGP
jgi:hypothetical protein